MGNDDKPSNWVEQTGERVPVNNDVDKQHGRTLGKLESATTSKPTDPSIIGDTEKKNLKGESKEGKLIRDGNHKIAPQEYDKDLHVSKVNEGRDLAQAKSNAPKVEPKVSANITKRAIAVKAIQKVGLRLIPLVGTAITVKEIYDLYQEHEESIHEFKDELLERFGEFLEPDDSALIKENNIPELEANSTQNSFSQEELATIENLDYSIDSIADERPDFLQDIEIPPTYRDMDIGEPGMEASDGSDGGDGGDGGE